MVEEETHGDDEVIVERFSAYMDSWNLVNFSWNRTGVSNLLRKRTEISDTGWERFLIDQTLVLWCCFCKGFTILMGKLSIELMSIFFVVKLCKYR